jgi:hypothetical protein
MVLRQAWQRLLVTGVAFAPLGCGVGDIEALTTGTLDVATATSGPEAG